ncbi:MAG: response regulator [Lachnospiraceae bacterium]|nr:response regulator [Lachnospiraceae bacterium]
MMKLLIVDDEKLTRNGLKTSIDWESLHISEIYEADNGVDGLQLAMQKRPEIILTDVRMPRMDGVQMATRLHESLPECAIIFMSGYSDKEYLKAAIKLGAVNYVEKPLDAAEITEAVAEAQSRILATSSIKLERSMALENRFASLLTQPSASLEQALSDPHFSLPPSLKQNDTFTCLIIQFADATLEFTERYLSEVLPSIDEYLGEHNLQEVHCIKHGRHLCLFLYGSSKKRERLIHYAEKIRSLIQPLGDVFLSVGDSVEGVRRAYDSYQSAVILLQGSFFYDHNKILINDPEAITTPPMITDLLPEYSEALSARDADRAEEVLNRLAAQFAPPCPLLASQVKDIYYKYYLQLQHARQSAQITQVDDRASIWEMIDSASTLLALHRELRARTDEFLQLLQEHSAGSSMIYAIREFIHANYMNDSLSVKSISDHVKRSAPYVCTLFKNETGQTLNQYITEYRVEKARLLLDDPRYKISDVAEKVGYLDVNYFGKIFKKVVGLSPTEYRNH